MSSTAMDLDLIKVLWKDYGISLKWISTSTDGDTSPESDYACHGSSLYVSLRRVEAVSVSVRNLGIEVVRKPAVSRLWRQVGQSKADDEERASPETKILDGVSADIPAGQIMAIIGSSGCGKTSMLNAMANRMRGQNLRITGSTTFNESRRLSSVRHAYVMQQDVLLPRLTVRETLRYSAELRLPASTTAEERERAVEEVILQLGLKECADTLVGDSVRKGCSGGEKRRVSIGVQLLSNPSVLFLDEPTTGLDATSAFQLMRTLKNLAIRGRTIITTLHQPRSEIWGMLDRITLLARGNVLYSGSIANVPKHFAPLGHPFPDHISPPDFLIDLAAIDYRNSEAEVRSIARINSLTASWREHESWALPPKETVPPRLAVAAETGFVHEGVAKPALWRQISMLTRRGIKTTYRDPMGLSGCLLEAIAMGLIAGWIFYQVDGSLSGIRSRQAALYNAACLQGYLVLMFETCRLCEVDIRVFDREHGEGVVGVVAFLTSRRLAKMLTEDIPVPFLFSVLFYFMCGFDNDAVQFFTFFAVVLVGQYLAVTFATMCVGLTRNVGEASLIGNLAYALHSMASGFLIQANTIPVYLRWTRYISYNWYALGALMSNEFTDSFYDCPSEGGRENPNCLEYDGNHVLRLLDFPRDWIATPILACVAWLCGFYVVAGLLYHRFTVDINVSSVKVNDDKDRSAGTENLSPEENTQTRGLDVVLEDYRLTLTKPGFFGMGRMQLEILKGVSTKFEAGKLNVIMGPSGSGKSSLLNLMAQRLHSSFTARYGSSGRMLFNGSTPSDSVVRSLCSYVTQDDDALLPSLTVRETLRYAAALRLPSTMSAAEKERRAEEIILKMGLRDCADIVIGSEFLKGISGGQKRRVTIAVQILTEPRILLLDEPTSGLDAFTAGSILTVLRALADEGRTVICTIHQSRNDLFEKFGNVLLLARGGSTVYSGKAAQMLPYFSSLGHTCPKDCNPADFCLDIVSVDLQQEDREAESRVRVQNLISRFSHPNALASGVGKGSGNRTISLLAELGQMKRDMAPISVAYSVLLKRSLLNIKRQPSLIVARLMQVLGLGIVHALFFAPLKNDYYSVQNRMGFVQQLSSLYFVGLLQNVAIYPHERDVFYKESDDQAYSTTSFFLAYTTCEIPFEISSCLLFSLLTNVPVGLPRTAEMFFMMATIVLCVTNCGESLGIIFNTFFQHTGFSISVTSTVLGLGVAMAGIMSTDMPTFLDRINYISPLKYMMQCVAPVSLKGVIFTCEDWQKLPSGRCPVENGDDVMRLYGIDGQKPWQNLAIVVGITVTYRLIAYLAVLAKRSRWKMGKSVGGAA